MTDTDGRLAIIERADAESGALCHGRRQWTMSIPPQATDSDVTFGDLSALALQLLERVRELEADKRRLDWIDTHYGQNMPAPWYSESGTPKRLWAIMGEVGPIRDAVDAQMTAEKSGSHE